MKKIKPTLYFVLSTLLLFNCTSTVKLDNTWKRDFNVCKILKEKVVIYPVFIEERRGEVWSKEDRASFIDSIKVATNWLKKQAEINDVELIFDIVPHPTPIQMGLPGKSIDGTYSLSTNIIGVSKINKHYDNIAKKGFRSIKNQKGALKPFVSRGRAKDDFVAKIRNQHQAESVVLMFVHKPEKKNNILFTVNTLSNKDVEYSVNSFNQPSVIAEQILELFGAAFLQYDVKKKKQKEIDILIEENFPNEIMLNPFLGLKNAELGAVTQYLIGWKSEFDPKFQILMEGRRAKVRKK